MTVLLLAVVLSQPYVAVVRWSEMQPCVTLTTTVPLTSDGTVPQCGGWVPVEHTLPFKSLDEIQSYLDQQHFNCDALVGVWDLRVPKRIDVGCELVRHPRRVEVIHEESTETIWKVLP